MLHKKRPKGRVKEILFSLSAGMGFCIMGTVAHPVAAVIGIAMLFIGARGLGYAGK